MPKSLFENIIEWETSLFGFPQRGLDGQALIKTELSWVNAYFCQRHHFKQACHLSISEIPALSWRSFVCHLYNVNRANLKRICLNTDLFLCDLLESSPHLQTPIESARGAMAVQVHDVERLFKIRALFEDRHSSWFYLPQPTETLEESVLNDQLSRLQQPESEQRVKDTFRLVSRHIKKGVAYFKGERSNASALIQLDAPLLKLLQEGDRLPMSLIRGQEGLFFIESAKWPLISDES